nr:MAG TPA: hypothetical protein [Caudoviricetes sp.]
MIAIQLFMQLMKMFLLVLLKVNLKILCQNQYIR